MKRENVHMNTLITQCKLHITYKPLRVKYTLNYNFVTGEILNDNIIVEEISLTIKKEACSKSRSRSSKRDLGFITFCDLAEVKLQIPV